MNQANAQYYYDAEADVLYFSKGAPDADVITQETGDDIVMRIDPKSGKAVGFTILNFMKRAKDRVASVPLPFQMELTPVAQTMGR